LAWSGPAPGADKAQSEQVLKKQGLKEAGTLFILDKDESGFQDKLLEARRSGKELTYALMQQRGSFSEQEYKEMINQLNTGISQLRNQINAVNQQLGRIQPRNYGRFRSGYLNNYVAEEAAELQMYRTQLQAELNQDTYFLNQLRSQPFDPKAKQKVEAEVRDRREAYHSALLEVRKLADSTSEKYTALGKNDQVKKALDDLGRNARTKPKLGPSRAFQTSVKLLERLEREESGDQKADSQAKAARKARKSSRNRR
jgi:hypothetical protein